MSSILLGGPGEIPPVVAMTPMDEFENAIRKIGVVNACEWFDHQFDSKFTAETIDILKELSELEGKTV